MKVTDTATDTAQYSSQNPGWDYRIDRSLRFSRGCAELRSYDWVQATDDVWTLAPNIYLFDLALSPRPRPSRISYFHQMSESNSREMAKVLMIPHGATVRTNTAKGRQKSLVCAIDKSAINDLTCMQPNWDQDLPQEILDAHIYKFEWLLLKIYDEIRQEKFASEIMVETFAQALAVELVRCLGLGEPKPRQRSGGLAPWRMRRLRDRIHADLPAPSLRELAELCGLTVRHLCRAFKAETGRTMGEYVEAATIQRAHSMLTGTRSSVEEIAHALGFTTSSSFVRAFHRATGVRPRQIERSGGFTAERWN